MAGRRYELSWYEWNYVTVTLCIHNRLTDLCRLFYTCDFFGHEHDRLSRRFDVKMWLDEGPTVRTGRSLRHGDGSAACRMWRETSSTRNGRSWLNTGRLFYDNECWDPLDTRLVTMRWSVQTAAAVSMTLGGRWTLTTCTVLLLTSFTRVTN